MKQRTRYQEQIIKNYYKHQDSIQLSRLGDLVGKLYLDTGKTLERSWKNAAEAMAKLEVPQSRIDHLLEKRDPALVAKLVEELLGKS